MREAHPLAWLPPFCVGLCAAVAAEISLGLLLYSGPRLLRSLTFVLAVLLGALAAGLWSAPRSGARDLVEAVRRRWLLALVSFAVAATTAGAWSALGGLASARATRGLGLAFLAGLPLFASGAVLGAIGVTRPDRPTAVVAAAALGAATGALFTGLVLVPSLIPVSMYVFCLVALSAGALVHGNVLDRRPEDRLVDEETSVYGTVRVVDRVWGTPRRHERRLTVEGRLVGGTRDGSPLRPWERAVVGWIGVNGTSPEPTVDAGERGVHTRPGEEPQRDGGPDDGPSVAGEEDVRPAWVGEESGGPHPEEPGTGDGASDPAESTAILLVGGSAVSLQERLQALGRPLVVVERNPVVRRMTVRHFGLPRVAEGLRVETGDPVDVALENLGRFAFVVVDGAGTSAGDALPLLPAVLFRRLRGILPDRGVLVLGGDDPAVLQGEEAASALRVVLDETGFPKMKAFGSGRVEGPGRVLIVATGPRGELPGSVAGMEPLTLPTHVDPSGEGDDAGPAERGGVRTGPGDPVSDGDEPETRDGLS